MDVSYKQSPDDENIMNARAIKITGGKLKINWVGGEQYEMRDITKTQLDQRLDLKNRKWSFSICKADFLDIKKLSTINSNKIISVLINNGDIILSEPGAWEMEVDKTDKDRKTDLIISKKFLPCIEEMENIEFNIFENFMLIKSEDTNLMLSFEQSVDE
jgi:hypothetical protein